MGAPELNKQSGTSNQVQRLQSRRGMKVRCGPARVVESLVVAWEHRWVQDVERENPNRGSSTAGRGHTQEAA